MKFYWFIHFSLSLLKIILERKLNAFNKSKPNVINTSNNFY